MNFIQPNWPAPKQIKAYTTLRTGGVSLPPYNEFNLAEHVGEEIAFVQKNRDLLIEQLSLPNEPIWLQQTHSTIVLPALPDNRHQEADASFSSTPEQICIVLTADCLPIFLTNQQGTEVAAIHAGWRGLANGIIENTLAAMTTKENILAWLGPAIGPSRFEVGEDVRDAFLSIDPKAEHAFLPSPNGRWLANLYTLATLRLQKYGINAIYGGEHCTYLEKENFYSYRRDGSKTGRMASLIWISSSKQVK